MKRTGKSAFFYALLIIAISVLFSFEAISQSRTVTPKNSKAKISEKEPILKVSLISAKFKLGKPVELTLTIKNETNSTIVLFDADPLRGFDITIKDANGFILPLTKEGKRRKYPDIIMGRETVYLEPGKELKLRSIGLDKLFDLKRTGNYTVEVKRAYYLEDNSVKNTNSENKEKLLIGAAKFIIR